MSSLKQGWVDMESLTMKFGGELSKPENVFTAMLIPIPIYKTQKYERESLGNGWYGIQKELVEYNNQSFLVIKDNVCVGYIVNPTTASKVQVHKFDKSTPGEVEEFYKNWKK